MKIELEYIINEPDRVNPELIGPLNITFNDITQLYLNSVIDKRYNEFLKNKSVVIVGPAAYIESEQLGDFFDSFDVVVRLNRSYPVTNKKCHGSRCDIRYHNMSLNLSQGGPLMIDQMINDDVKYICSPFPKHLSYFHNDIKKCESELENSNINFHHWADLEQFLTLHMILQTRPNIGTCAILDLLNYDIKQLHISGITFFNDGYISTYHDRDDDLVPMYQTNNVINHAQKPQKELISMISQNDSRITLDKQVQEALWR